MMDSIKLLQGDCLERMNEIPDQSVDLVLADPPYGTTACKWDSVIPIEPMWEHLKRLIRPNGAIVMTASQPFTTTLISSNMPMFKYCWVWEKEQGVNFLSANRNPLKVHEDIVVFGGTNYFPQMTRGEPYISGHGDSGDVTGRTQKIQTKNGGNRYPRSIQRFHRETGLHPTQKPVALMAYLIRTYTNEGDTVLDFTMGSGTTGVAAVSLDRQFWGIELDPKHFETAKRRIQDELRKIEFLEPQRVKEQRKQAVLFGSEEVTA